MASQAVQAAVLARRLLASLPRRQAHVEEVARRAALIDPLRHEGDLLETCAWLHDIGYCDELAVTQFHPLDGARYLRTMGATERIVGLVAFHSSAASEAKILGIADQLAEFADERTLTRDLLWYLDMSTGPDGQRLSFAERMAEVRERYPANHYVIRALDLGMPERVAAVDRATIWLSSAGLDHV